MKLIHQPLNIHAHSTVDNWQSQVHTIQRSESVPTIPQQLYIEPHSRIDTWQKRRPRSLSNIPPVSQSKKTRINLF